MQKQTINILCATDDNYVPYCGIMLTSVFENNKDVKVDAYVIIDKPLSNKNIIRFKKLEQIYNQSITFLTIDNKILSRFPSKGMDYWSIAMYYRIFAEELLPNNISKVLYLDCDIVVENTLKALWEVDLTNKAVGVVQDIFTFSEEIYHRLSIPQELNYFNSGVLLMNVEYWRQNKICQQCLDYLQNSYDKLFANDQDVLNAVLWDKKIHLPISYNFQVQFLKHYFLDRFTSELKEQIFAVKKNPIIIHYAVPVKPWNVLYYNMPFKQIWKKYKLLSQWWYMLPELPKYKKINYIIKRYIFWPLGIMWKKDYIDF